MENLRTVSINKIRAPGISISDLYEGGSVKYKESMALEPVFAAFFAVLFGGESLTRRMLVGGALVVAAMYLVELRSTPRDPDATAAEDPPAPALHHDV